MESAGEERRYTIPMMYNEARKRFTLASVFPFAVQLAFFAHFILRPGCLDLEMLALHSMAIILHLLLTHYPPLCLADHSSP